jgi:transcriptional regulator with XRE-family HTH domain
MGLSQLALANQVDMAHNFINDLEHGKKWGSPDTLAKLCDALGIEPYELFLPEGTTQLTGEAPPPAYYDEVIEATRKAINTVKIRRGG